MSKEAKELVIRMLAYNPQERVSAAEALNDPWVVYFSSKRTKTGRLDKSMTEVMNGLRSFNVSYRAKNPSCR